MVQRLSALVYWNVIGLMDSPAFIVCSLLLVNVVMLVVACLCLTLIFTSTEALFSYPSAVTVIIRVVSL